MNYKHLAINKRFCIANFLELKWSLRKIAKYLDRNVSTISREIKRNSINGKYLAHVACENYDKRRLNCGSKCKSYNVDLINYTEDGLLKNNPKGICNKIKKKK